MASQQAFHPYSQSKGTLVPGQSITINRYNVQVERYLAQGGFAHVYLVRTAAPVFNTTHHVLKRIAVPNEAILKDVKKEVDVMRLLRNHPNIVYLIDAAWHKLPNGTYEVFILMEFCPGGGIIDMMNRRLRERLTEAEILQIFVDVCEGVACMHNLRPALLHRDLKVENILQSSPTSYKLCDFGSATAVSRPPTTIEEIRALEADLNRHTTLQYRAPEMVDLFSRKPVDEKSDVWALGVLLYKLCYYTTPFEEHGQLAILNVQYRIPPYPVYSLQMNQLIASMLQEHGIRRPTVFEVLLHVHRLRGTKSRFKYVIPVPQPLSPRQQINFQSPSPNHSEQLGIAPQRRVPMSVSPSKGQGVQAREKVMEAIAPLTTRGETRPQESGGSSNHHISVPNSAQPMRRGRPPIREPAKESESPASSSSSGSQILKHDKPDDWLDAKSDSHNIPSTSKTTKEIQNGGDSLLDGWSIDGLEPDASAKKDIEAGFGDDFGAKLWGSVGVDKTQLQAPVATPISRKSSPNRPSPSIGIRPPIDVDAFRGLGLNLSSEKPAPTLAEARKLRTGLAVIQRSGLRATADRSSGTILRHTPSPRQTTPSLYSSSVSSLSHGFQGSTLKPAQTSGSKRASPSPLEGSSPENRFPSLEQLDASFSPSPSPVPVNDAPRQEPEIPTRPTKYSANFDASLLKPELYARGYHARKGTRSEQATGTVPQGSVGLNSDINDNTIAGIFSTTNKETAGGLAERTRETKTSSPPGLMQGNQGPTPVRPINLANSIHVPVVLSPPLQSTNQHSSHVPGPVKQQDWLTGDDEIDNSSSTPYHTVPSDEMPILRDSPSKRASLIYNDIAATQAGVTAQQDHAPYLTRTSSSSEVQISPTLSRFARSFPPVDIQDKDVQPAQKGAAKLPPTNQSRDTEFASSEDEGPEEAVSVSKPVIRKPGQRKGHKGRQSSVHELVDLYGGGVNKEKDRNVHISRPVPQDSPQDLRAQSTAAPPREAKLGISISSSLNTLLSPPSIKPPNHSAGNNKSSNLTASRPSVKSTSRSRPQSLIIFPSKPLDPYPTTAADQPSLSPGLTPPEGAKHHKALRRTSISDMVQLYEDITSGTKLAGPSSPLSPVAPRLIGLGRISPIDARSTRSTADNEKPSILSPSYTQLNNDKPLRSSAEPKQVSPAFAIRKPIPLRNGSIRREPMDNPNSSAHDTSVSTRPMHEHTDNLSPRLERTSSPERPYQGVGKLIDQWQRKTAEAAESQRPQPKGRGPFAIKREIAQDSHK